MYHRTMVSLGAFRGRAVVAGVVRLVLAVALLAAGLAAGWLANHPREAASMGRSGRAKALREFSWPRVAGRIERAYHGALGTALKAKGENRAPGL